MDSFFYPVPIHTSPPDDHKLATFGHSHPRIARSTYQSSRECAALPWSSLFLVRKQVQRQSHGGSQQDAAPIPCQCGLPVMSRNSPAAVRKSSRVEPVHALQPTQAVPASGIAPRSQCLLSPDTASDRAEVLLSHLHCFASAEPLLVARFLVRQAMDW